MEKFAVFLYLVERQKRALLWLKEKNRITHIDYVISAELPNPEEDPGHIEIISKNIIHGTCNLLILNQHL